MASKFHQLHNSGYLHVFSNIKYNKNNSLSSTDHRIKPHEHIVHKKHLPEIRQASSQFHSEVQFDSEININWRSNQAHIEKNAASQNFTFVYAMWLYQRGSCKLYSWYVKLWFFRLSVRQFCISFITVGLILYSVAQWVPLLKKAETDGLVTLYKANLHRNPLSSTLDELFLFKNAQNKKADKMLS